MKTYGKVTGIVAAIAALAVSGIALAQPDPNRVTGKDKDKDAPGTPKTKTSVQVVNLCEPVESYYDESKMETVPGTFLKVTSTITNESGDEIEDSLQIGPTTNLEVSQIQVGGLQLVKSDGKPGKKEWKPVGAVDYTPNAELTILPEQSDDYIVYLDLCGSYNEPFDENAIGLNAEVQIMIQEGDGAPVRNFVGNCDGEKIYDADGNVIGDESQIDLDDPDYKWLKDSRGCPASP
jgi:hypothetical protein